MISIVLLCVCAAFFVAASPAYAQVDTIKKAGKTAADKAEDAAGKGKNVVKEAADKTEDAAGKTKNVVTEAADKTEDAAGETADTGKVVYKGGKRVGYTVGNKTWDGTKWVATSSWTGGTWVAHKTKKGTKWVYHKGKGTSRKAM